MQICTLKQGFFLKNNYFKRILSSFTKKIAKHQTDTRRVSINRDQKIKPIFLCSKSRTVR